LPKTIKNGQKGVYISTGTGDEFLDVCDFILLFVVGFRLVCFEFFLCADVGVVVSAVVDEFTVDGEVHDLITYVVEEILGVGCQNETMRVFRKVCFEPDDCFKIEMVCGFVEQQQEWLDE
jgi:hypothetical protein